MADSRCRDRGSSPCPLDPSGDGELSTFRAAGHWANRRCAASAKGPGHVDVSEDGLTSHIRPASRCIPARLARPTPQALRDRRRHRPPAWVTGSQGEVPARHLAAAHHPAAGPAGPRPWPTRLAGFRSRLGWCECSRGSGTSARDPVVCVCGGGAEPEAPPAGSPCGARPQDPGPVTRTEGRRSRPRRPALVPPMDNGKPTNQGPRSPCQATPSPPEPPAPLPCAPAACMWHSRDVSKGCGACRPPRTP